MNKQQGRLLTAVVWILAAIGFVIFFFTTNGQDGPTTAFVTYGIILTVVSIAIAIIFALVNLIKHTDSFKTVLLAAGVLIFIFIVSYVLSDSNPVLDATGAPIPGSEGSVSKWIGTSIYYSMILLVISGGMFLWDLTKNLIKQ